MFLMEIDTKNAYFETDAPRVIADMLRNVADVLEKRIEETETAYISLRDGNGNTVGGFYYGPDARACDHCKGTGETEISVGGDGYGGGCCASADVPSDCAFCDGTGVETL